MYSKILKSRRRTIKQAGFWTWLFGGSYREFKTEANWLDGSTKFLHYTSKFGMEYIEAVNSNGTAYVSLRDCPFKLGEYDKGSTS